MLRPAYLRALRPVLGAAAVRDSLLQRFCRSIADQFDVLVSGYNPCYYPTWCSRRTKWMSIGTMSRRTN